VLSKKLIAPVFVFLCFSSKGQVIDRYVFNSTGINNTIGSVEYISSFGEPVVGESPQALIGFLQPELDISINYDDFNLNLVRIYPNPASDILNYISNLSITKATITNQLGQVVFVKDNLLKEGYFELQDLANGVYFLSFFYEKAIVSSFKIVKIDD
jgi:hypothetical protein